MTTSPTPAPALRSVCPSCGTVFTRDASGRASCTDCSPGTSSRARWRLQDRERGSRQQRGYDAAWDRLSRRARRLQPFCLDCGSTEDLTADHSLTAWERRAAGKLIRLQDIDVLCRRCNAERGDPRDPDRAERAGRPERAGTASSPETPGRRGTP